MLCSRPNEGSINTIEKELVSLIIDLSVQEESQENKEDESLVPNSMNENHSTTVSSENSLEPQKEILNRHKKWLEQFKTYVHNKNNEKEEREQHEKEKKERIREQAEADRERSKKMKQEYQNTASNVLKILDDQPSQNKQSAITNENLRKLDEKNEKQAEEETFKKKKKLEKPVWAQTKQEIEEKEDQEIDDLLEFFEKNNVEEYSEDQQVKGILRNLKNKIEQLKEQENWKEKEVQKIKDKKNQEKSQEDAHSITHSNNSDGAKSVASEKSQKRVQELRSRQNQQEEWDKHTITQKSQASNIDDRIAKNIADDVLHNYPNMRGVHSNSSIRRLLEHEAAKAINEPIVRPVITTIVKDKAPIDANNLPYLHRNPAI